MKVKWQLSLFVLFLSKFKPRKLIEILFCYVYTFLFPDNYIHGNLKRRGNKSQMSHLWQTSNFIAWTALWVIHELFSNKWICGFLSFIWLWLHAKKLVHFKFFWTLRIDNWLWELVTSKPLNLQPSLGYQWKDNIHSFHLIPCSTLVTDYFGHKLTKLVVCCRKKSSSIQQIYQHM